MSVDKQYEYIKINICPGLYEAAMKTVNIRGYTVNTLVTILTLPSFLFLVNASFHRQWRILEKF